MAITFTNRGTRTDSGTTLAFAPSGNFAAGSMAVLAWAADNAHTGGAVQATLTVTDSHGNVWTKRQHTVYDPGAASEGIEGAIFTTPMEHGTLTTGSVITVTVGTSVGNAVASLVEAVPAAGMSIVYVGGGNDAGEATAAPTYTTASVYNANGIVAALFNEYGSAQTVTGDADTTNGTWGSAQTVSVGFTDAGVTVSTQTKTVSATATQTFNPTLGTSSDVTISYIELAECSIGIPKKNAKYAFTTTLVSQADTKLLLANPTLASGDFKVSIGNGSLANLAILPFVSPASNYLVQVILTEAEMNGSDVNFLAVDAAGAEWCSQSINLKPQDRTIDELAYPATAYRSIVVDSSGIVDANAVKVGPTGSGTDQTAGDIVAAIAGVGTSGGAAINTDAATDNASGGISGVTSATTKVGTQTGTFANTSNVNSVYHVVTGTATDIDWVYQFLCGGGTSPVAAKWTGYVSGINDTVTFYAWNHVGSAWESLGTQVGQAGTTNIVKDLILYARHMGTSNGELGKVYIRVACTGMTNPVINTDQLYVSYAVTSRSVGYSGGFVWVDTMNGVAGTESYVNGTADNPVSTIADAETISANLGIRQFYVVNQSTITLPTNRTGYTYDGHTWGLALNNKTLIGCCFHEANISGVAAAAGSDLHFECCEFGTATIPWSHASHCTFTGTTTFNKAGDYLFADCMSQVAGAGTPVFDFGGVAAITCSFRRWSGGIKLTNLAADSVVSIDVVSGGTVTLEGNAGAIVNIRGMASSIVNTAGCTVNTNAVINRANLDAWQAAAAVASVVGDVGGDVVGDVQGDLLGSGGGGGGGSSSGIS